MNSKSKYLLRLEDGRNEPIKDLDNALRLVLVDRERTGAEDVTFAYCRFEAETSTHKKHVHAQAEEIMYILSGRGRGGVNEEEFEMKKGDSVWVPRGAVHWFENPFAEACEMLFIYTRPSLSEAGYEVVE